MRVHLCACTLLRCPAPPGARHRVAASSHGRLNICGDLDTCILCRGRWDRGPERCFAGEISHNHLSEEHRKIKIRESQVIFFNNLMLTLIARKAAGAYDCTWAVLFVPTWIIFAFTALTIMIVILAQVKVGPQPRFFF